MLGWTSHHFPQDSLEKHVCTLKTMATLRNGSQDLFKSFYQSHVIWWWIFLILSKRDVRTIHLWFVGLKYPVTSEYYPCLPWLSVLDISGFITTTQANYVDDERIHANIERKLWHADLPSINKKVLSWYPVWCLQEKTYVTKGWRLGWFYHQDK